MAVTCSTAAQALSPCVSKSLQLLCPNPEHRPCLALAAKLVSRTCNMAHMIFGSSCSAKQLGGSAAVQVRSAHRLSEHGLTQQLTIQGVSMLPDTSGAVFIITSTRDGIQQLVPVPFAQQAQALAELQQFPEALAMTSLMSDGQVSVCMS